MRALQAIAFLLVLCVGSMAQADGTEPPDANARPIFEAGRDAYEQGRYLEAIDSFERVFEMTGHPYMLVNIANAKQKLGADSDAARALEHYLELVPQAPDRAPLEARIAELDASALVQQRAAHPPEPPAPPAPTGLFAGRTYTWLVLGGGAVLAGVATALWVDTSHQYDALLLTCGMKGKCSDKQVSDLDSKLSLTNTMWGLSAAAVVASAVLYFVEPAWSTPSSERLTVAPTLSMNDGFGIVAQGHL